MFKVRATCALKLEHKLTTFSKPGFSHMVVMVIKTESRSFSTAVFIIIYTCKPSLRVFSVRSVVFRMRNIVTQWSLRPLRPYVNQALAVETVGLTFKYDPFAVCRIPCEQSMPQTSILKSLLAVTVEPRWDVPYWTLIGRNGIEVIEPQHKMKLKCCGFGRNYRK
jgi:hypothetical protein